MNVLVHEMCDDVYFMILWLWHVQWPSEEANWLRVSECFCGLPRILDHLRRWVCGIALIFQGGHACIHGQGQGICIHRQGARRLMRSLFKIQVKEHFLDTVRDAADHTVARSSNFVQSEVPIWEISSSLILFAHWYQAAKAEGSAPATRPVEFVTRFNTSSCRGFKVNFGTFCNTS